MRRGLLGHTVQFNPQGTLVQGILNSPVARPLFSMRDRMKLSKPPRISLSNNSLIRVAGGFSTALAFASVQALR